MKINEYQEQARTTSVYPLWPSIYAITYPALGLCGEAGEVANKVKKVIRDNEGKFDELHKRIIADELGDCLWYIANLATDLGFSLQTIAEENLRKLKDRKERNRIHGSGDRR